MIVDYHTHLRDSEGKIDHTVEAVERFVESAAARGVDEVGIGEHVYYFRQTASIWSIEYQSERCVYDLEKFVGAVVEAKRRGWPVKLGLEVDHVGERQAELHDLLAPYPWDYLLGSVHYVDGQAIDLWPGMWCQASAVAVWDAYWGALTELAASGFVDVLAHPDLPKIFGIRPERIEYPALDGVVLEISTAGLHKQVRELYPDPAMLAGRPPVTLASDAHVPENVGRDFDRALALARAAGIDTVTVFDGRVRRQAPLG